MVINYVYFRLQPKYIPALINKAKVREREQEIVYERKLAKERSEDEHLYADKDKFLTSAYKKKLAEQAKWVEEERLRELREQKDDVSWTLFFSLLIMCFVIFRNHCNSSLYIANYASCQ